MSQQADLEAGGSPPTGPPRIALSNSKTRVPQLPGVLSLNNTIPSISTSTPTQPNPVANQARLRKGQKFKNTPPPQFQTSKQPEQIFEALYTDLEDGYSNNCLFMCWEQGANDQKAIPLKIRDTDDEVQVYRDMVDKWYEVQRWWWRYVPFYQVLGVEEVEVCI